MGLHNTCTPECLLDFDDVAVTAVRVEGDILSELQADMNHASPRQHTGLAQTDCVRDAGNALLIFFLFKTEGLAVIPDDFGRPFILGEPETGCRPGHGEMWQDTARSVEQGLERRCSTDRSNLPRCFPHALSTWRCCGLKRETGYTCSIMSLT
jgi:hypothetical protein